MLSAKNINQELLFPTNLAGAVAVVVDAVANIKRVVRRVGALLAAGHTRVHALGA